MSNVYVNDSFFDFVKTTLVRSLEDYQLISKGEYMFVMSFTKWFNGTSSYLDEPFDPGWSTRTCAETLMYRCSKGLISFTGKGYRSPLKSLTFLLLAELYRARFGKFSLESGEFFRDDYDEDGAYHSLCDYLLYLKYFAINILFDNSKKSQYESFSIIISEYEKFFSSKKELIACLHYIYDHFYDEKHELLFFGK